MAGSDLLYRMSFSGQDASVWAYLVPSDTQTKGVSPIKLEAMQTLSISVFRDKIPVRALGYSNVLGFTRGPRSVAGSMIFTILHDHPLKDMFGQYDYDFSFDKEYSGRDYSDDYEYIFPDSIPPFNLVVVYNNELGYSAVLHILGVDMISDGITTSTEDMITENTYQYRARDIRIFKSQIGANGKIDQKDITDTVQSLLNNTVNSNIPIPEASTSSLDQRAKQEVKDYVNQFRLND